jgi:RNA polymerase sigma factor (sigma-70 family)
VSRSSSINLNKTSQTKLKKFRKTLDEIICIDDPDRFISVFSEVLKSEIKALKGCSERAITDYYLESIKEQLNNCNEIDEDFFDRLKVVARGKLARHYTDYKTYDNNIDIYFNDVKREYIKSPMSDSDNLEFLPENRDTFIKNNLKLVINCAKRYQNLGLPFEDLIQIGNYGLCVAFDKFDTEKANLKNTIVKNIKESSLESFTNKDAEEIIKKSFTYSKDLERTLNLIPEDGFVDKDEFLNWTNKNIKTAIFASVAFQWIRAYILLELNKLSKVVRVPKSARKKTDEEGNKVNSSITIINLDSVNPYTDDTYYDDELAKVTNEEFIIEDEYVENLEKQDILKEVVEKALCNLSVTDRRIIKKRFGVGMPYQLSINEISESEGIPANKVKYIITQALKNIGNSLTSKEKEMIITLLD